MDDAYEDKAPYAFTGTLRSVVFDRKPLGLESEQALREAARTAGVAGSAGVLPQGLTRHRSRAGLLGEARPAIVSWINPVRLGPDRPRHAQR